MRPQDKNTMVRNLRTFLSRGNAGLQEHQTDILEAAESFLRLPNGATFVQQGRDDTQEQGIKKGDYFEAVSATGTGKTRAFGTMAKAMDVPTLIVTPRNLLNKQTKKEFCEEIGIPESQIAVYDSKQSAAERRRVLEGNPPPQFVITSYQSLPSLIERHELQVTNYNDLHYRPLVILDEVQEAQGTKTAAIINRLKKDVLVAGFTATDAGASYSIFEGQKPIFHLPIAHAIEKGILCNGIRTGVIDVAIDEDWIERFRNTPKSRDYSREDIEKFARTPSVIEGAVQFHLTHVDDELGRINRLPTVFYTQGVNAARIGAEEFNEKAKEMGLHVRAAYVSGDMGQKEYQPILDQFKRGEIQAVFNDKLLGMGFDAKNATICYSLQPSNVPDVVEQQLGRVGRKQDADYAEKYGQDKVSLAINVRGKGMNPVLFAQVLANPSVYNRRKTPKPSFKDKTDAGSLGSELPQGVEVHLDYNDMKAVLADADKRRTSLDFPVRTDEWLGIDEMAVSANRGPTFIINKYNALRVSWSTAKAEGKATFNAEGITLPVGKAGIFLAGNGQPYFCIHEDALPQFKSAEEKPDNYLGASELKDRIGNRRVLSEVYEHLQIAWQRAVKNGESQFSADGVSLPTDKAGMYRIRNHTVFCLHEDVMPQLRAFEVGTENNGEWLNIQDMITGSGVSRQMVSGLYRELAVAWDDARVNKKSTFSFETITLPTDKAQMIRIGLKPFFHLHEDAISQIKSYKTMPEKTDYWLDCNEMAIQVDKPKSEIMPLYSELQRAWQTATKANAEKFTVRDIMLPVSKAGSFGSFDNPVFCIHESCVGQFRPKPPSLSDGWLVITEMAARAKRAPDTISSIYAALSPAYEKARQAKSASFSAGGITLSIDKAKLFMAGEHKSVFYVHESAASLFEQQTPKKTSEWLGLRDMIERSRKSQNTISGLYKALQPAWEEARKKGEASFSAAGVTLPTAKAGKFLGAQYTTFCLHEETADLISQYRPSRMHENLNFVEKVGAAKSIVPESEHLKRIGRNLGKNEA